MQVLLVEKNQNEDTAPAIKPPFKVGCPDDAPRVIVVGRKVYQKGSVGYGGLDSYIAYKRVNARFIKKVVERKRPYR